MKRRKLCKCTRHTNNPLKIALKTAWNEPWNRLGKRTAKGTAKNVRMNMEQTHGRKRQKGTCASDRKAKRAKVDQNGSQVCKEQKRAAPQCYMCTKNEHAYK